MGFLSLVGAGSVGEIDQGGVITFWGNLVDGAVAKDAAQFSGAVEVSVPVADQISDG